MRYINVPLPKPFIDKMDRIIADTSNDYRSRPDFILHNLRPIVEKKLYPTQQANE